MFMYRAFVIANHQNNILIKIQSNIRKNQYKGMPPKENKTSVSTVSLGGLLTVFDTVDLVVLSIKKK